jgi:16S rRNA (guanine527-N7)-methyltransferase
LLLAWTGSINLTAIREPSAVASLHVADSLTAVEPLRARGIDALVDIGSGGGFPGLPLAAVLPAARALLVDSMRKKAAFLEAVVTATGLRQVRVAAVRAEALAADPRHRERWPAVTSRAVGGLADVVEIGFPLVAPGGCVVTWKRQPIDAELEPARRAVDALGGGRIDVVATHVRGLDGHVLVFATKGGRTAERYPRDPAERRRRPW